MNSAEYQITIKSANQKVDDYVLDCKSAWTVQRLKQHISETHINKPNIEEQRLIYAGNLLKDSLTLKQVFFRDSLCTELTNSSKTEFTIHLVCSTHLQKSAPSQPKSNPSEAASNSNQTPPSGSNVPTTSISTNSPGQAQPTISSSPDINPVHSNQSSTATQFGSSANQSNAPSSGMTRASPLTATQAAEIASNLLQSDHVRQQHAIFQQLANLVAAQIVQHLANGNIVNPIQDNPITDPVIHLDGLMPLLNNQLPNIQTPTTTTTSTVATQSDSHSVANSVASQLLYAGNRQPNQFVPQSGQDSARSSGVHQNEQNLNGDNGANAPPRVINQPAGVQFGLGAQAGQAGGGEVAPAPPQGPVIDQPAAPQPMDADAPMMQHDVIDWVYYSIRAMVLMAALYIHASLFRLLFIVGLLAIAYFFNRRSARRVQNQQDQGARPDAAHMQPARPEGAGVGGDNEQPPNADQDHARVAAGPNQDGGELRRRRVPGQEDNNDDNQAEGAAQQQQDVAQRRVSFLKLCYLVITDFLASLVPE